MTYFLLLPFLPGGSKKGGAGIDLRCLLIWRYYEPLNSHDDFGNSFWWCSFSQQHHYVRFSQFYWHVLANLLMHIFFMLQVCIIAIWSQGLILNSGRSYTTFDTKIPVLRANSECTFWVQNGKNNGFTKMSVELWKSYIVNFCKSIVRGRADDVFLENLMCKLMDDDQRYTKAV